MDFSNRGAQPQPVAAPSTHASAPVSKKRDSADDGKLGRVVTVVVAVLVAVLIVGVALLLAGNKNNGGNESGYVDSSKLQAVFLNTGQVYFGKIKTLNNNYFVVTNIYYLQTSTTGTTTATSSSSVSLVKLGCELHEPLDQMVINRSQVTFWENLSPDGQVAKAVATFQKDNPGGQKCTDQSSASANSTSSTVQNAGTAATPAATTGTTPTATTTGR